MLEQAFKVAEENGVMLYDIMTERYEITTMIQRELSLIPEVLAHCKQELPKSRPSPKKVCTTFSNMFREIHWFDRPGFLMWNNKAKALWM
jgi:hypothetical protein